LFKTCDHAPKRKLLTLKMPAMVFNTGTQTDLTNMKQKAVLTMLIEAGREVDAVTIAVFFFLYKCMRLPRLL